MRAGAGRIHLEPPGHLERFDRAVVDVDGTMLLGGRALPGAREFVDRLNSTGCTVCFATNASFATGATIAARLREAGIPAEDHRVVTAIEVLAHHLATNGGDGPVAALGSDAALDILCRAGVKIIRTTDVAPTRSITELVIAGLSHDVVDDEIAATAAALAPEVRVTVPNLDVGMVVESGVLAGTAAILARLAHITSSVLDVTDVGKPTEIFAAAVDRISPCPGSTLVVGDSLTSDVPLGTDRGWESLLVLTGATTLVGLAGLEGEAPEMVVPDLRAALERGWGES